MKTHRQELALQLGQTAGTITADAAGLPTTNEPSIPNVTNNIACTQEVELIEVSYPSDIHLNQALQATQLAVSGHQTTVLPQYQPSNADGLDQSNMVQQQPTVIHDYRSTVVTDLQLQNVFNAQVGCWLLDWFLIHTFILIFICIVTECRRYMEYNDDDS